MSNEVSIFVLASVRMVARHLTTQEMAALFTAVSLGSDPRQVIGYEKAKSLFTEAYGTRMHRDTQLAFGEVVSDRLDEEF